MGTVGRIWNDRGTDFRVVRLWPLPPGYKEKTCPKCGDKQLTGAIIAFQSGDYVTPDANETDPNILCQNCGYWADVV